jgi:membrane protease YdiL (CAAX protease family)
MLYTGHRLPLGFEVLRAALLTPFLLITRESLRGFILTLIAFLTGNWVQRMIEHHWHSFQQAHVSRQMYADAWLALIPSGLIALTLFRSGLTRKDIYLVPGNLNARVAGLGLVRWSLLTPVFVLVAIFGLKEQLDYITLANNHAAQKPGWIALIVLSATFAAINAFNEEFRFRFVLLARGKRSVGATAALWMTSLNFGLAHWGSGHPGGPTGALTTTLFAILLVRNLYDTEGGLGAWLMHAASDVIILVVVLLRVG